MDRWKRLNVFASLGGLAVCIISALFVKYNPLILCISAFSLGIAWKGFKNIYKNDEIYFICGSDNLKEITTWKNYDYILDNFKLIVIRRNNDDINEILSKINSKNIVIPNINSDNISSSYIRKNINNKKILKIMDENIVKYIIENNLYR